MGPRFCWDDAIGQNDPTRLAGVRRAARVPGAPARAGESVMIGGERTTGLSIMRGDDVLGLADFPLQFDNVLGRLAGRFRAGDLAIRKVGALEMPQGLTK